MNVMTDMLQVNTEWGNQTGSTAEKGYRSPAERRRKEPILTQAVKGDTLEILEQMETWSKVKTADAVIGYVENKRLGEITEETETPVTDYQAPGIHPLPQTARSASAGIP